MRRYDRRRAVFPVTVRAAGSKTAGSIHLDSADLSEGGAFLGSELLLEVGDTLELQIPLPGGKTIETAGRVVRVSRTGGGDRGPGMGIEFTKLATPDRAALAAALASSAAARAPASGKPEPPP
jgi:Tfp pilus assembly protein PilZ